MPRLIWAPAALADVARLRRFLAATGPEASRRAVRAIRAGVDLLRHHPEIGRPAETLAPEFREWLIEFGDGGYVVLYRYDGHEVAVLAVRHGREAGF